VKYCSRSCMTGSFHSKTRRSLCRATSRAKIAPPTRRSQTWVTQLWRQPMSILRAEVRDLIERRLPRP